MSACEILRVDKKAMMEALHREHAFSDMFVAYLLSRNIRYEEDLVDQLFNSSEKRLARILLLLARFGKEGAPEDRGPKNQPGDVGRDGGHHSFASQLLHEPLPEIRFYSLQRRATSPQLAAQRSSARLSSRQVQSGFRISEVLRSCFALRQDLGRAVLDILEFDVGVIRQFNEGVFSFQIANWVDIHTGPVPRKISGAQVIK